MNKKITFVIATILLAVNCSFLFGGTLSIKPAKLYKRNHKRVFEQKRIIVPTHWGGTDL